MGDVDWENMSDEEWAHRLARRITGETGETWFGNGVEESILVAMKRARKQGFAAGVEAAAKWLRWYDDNGEFTEAAENMLDALRPAAPDTSEPSK